MEIHAFNIRFWHRSKGQVAIAALLQTQTYPSPSSQCTQLCAWCWMYLLQEKPCLAIGARTVSLQCWHSIPEAPICHPLCDVQDRDSEMWWCFTIKSPFLLVTEVLPRRGCLTEKGTFQKYMYEFWFRLSSAVVPFAILISVLRILIAPEAVSNTELLCAHKYSGTANVAEMLLEPPQEYPSNNSFLGWKYFQKPARVCLMGKI